MHQRWSARALVGLCAALLASCGSPPEGGPLAEPVVTSESSSPAAAGGGECRGFAISFDDSVETSGTPQEALEVWREGYNENADSPLSGDGWTAVDDPSMPGQGVDLSQGRQSIHVMIINGGWIVDAGTTCS